MRNLLASAGMAILVLAPFGCSNTGSTGGTPGTKDSFTLKGPSLPTIVKQGDRQTIKLSLDRGSDFKRVVKMDAVVPKGLKAEFGTKEVNPSDPAEVTFTIEANKDASIGESKIHVTATPDTGKPSSIDVTVKVEDKK